MISIITVNFFSEKDILKCYESISKKTRQPFELVLISNSPLKEDFVDEVTSSYPSIKIKETGSNLGFAQACNLGAKLSTGEFLFFLNPDTRFINDVLTELLRCYESNDTVGIIGPKTFEKKGIESPTIKNDLDLYFFLLLSIPLGKYFINRGRIGDHFAVNSSQAVPIVNGHALFLKAELYTKLGGMEENFFMYWEENDLCLRARQTGVKVFFSAEAELIHLSGTSTSPYFIEMEIEKHRSQKKFILKHHPKWNILNRSAGVLGYLWRTVGSLVTLNKTKVLHFWTLFSWYSFKYK